MNFLELWSGIFWHIAMILTAICVCFICGMFLAYTGHYFIKRKKEKNALREFFTKFNSKE